MSLGVPSFTLGVRTSPNSTPFILVPSNNDALTKNNHLNPHFHHSQAFGTTFQPPVAHKHAHRLHSIPPRQKTTKTLILDHFLWLHAVARIAQGKAQSGVSHDSDSVCDSLRYGGIADKKQKLVQPSTGDIDLAQARALKARAEGLEKVLAAMIVEPVGPASSSSIKSNVAVSEGETSAQKQMNDGNTLPNGVRVRVAIAALINDLIAYSQPPAALSTPSPNPTATASTASPTTNTQTAAGTETGTVPDSNRTITKTSSCIPEALLPISRASYSDHVSNRLPSLAMLTSSPKLPASSPSPSNSESNLNLFNSQTWAQPLGIIGAASHAEQTASNQLPRRSSIPRSRTRDLFNAGVESQSTTRCDRHLGIDCPSCVAAPAVKSSIGSGLSRLTDGRPFRRAKDTTQDTTSQSQPHALRLLSHFLRLSALVSAELSKEAMERRNSGEANQDDVIMAYDPAESPSSFSSSSCSSTSGTPRELSSGNNVDSWSDSNSADDAPKSKKFDLPFLPNHSNTNESSQHSTFEQASKPADPEARPTREWYALLAGLLTRAVLEGYMLRGWKGIEAAEMVFGIGLAEGSVKEKKMKQSKKSLFSRKNEEPSAASSSEDLPTFLTPDNLPSLSEAAAMLFTRTTANAEETSGTDSLDPVQEYTAELEKRLSEFLNVPSHCPDLASHLDALSQQYSAEPVETAAVRFCEAVCQWREKPELESYKNCRGPPAQTRDTNTRPSPYLHGGHSGHSGHSRSPSVQSVSSMIHQTPGKQRHQSLASNTSLVHSVDSLNASSPLTSMSIASLVHHPVSPPSFTESITSDSVVSVNILGMQPTPKRPIDTFFAVDNGSNDTLQQQLVSDESQMQVESTLGVMIGPKAKSQIDIWTRFTIGAKRPREASSESRPDGERPGKKALFVTSGRFNT